MNTKRACPENKCTRWLTENLLLILTILGVGLGIALGFGLKAIEPPLDELDIAYVKFPGSMLLQVRVRNDFLFSINIMNYILIVNTFI